MTTAAIGPAAAIVALGPHALAQRVPCTICRAMTGMPCVDADGGERTDPHHSRWIRYQHLIRQRPFTAVVRRKVDDLVEVDDVLLCVATDESGRLRVLADGLGHQTRPEYIDARAVEFRSFVEESSRRHTPRRGPHPRTHLGATA